MRQGTVSGEQGPAFKTLAEIDAAYKAYYDSITDEEAAEELAWVEGVTRGLGELWDQEMGERKNGQTEAGEADGALTGQKRVREPGSL